MTAPTSTGTPMSRTASSIDRPGRRVVGVGVEVGGVLRPDHQVGAVGRAGPDLGGQLVRGPDVVVEHGRRCAERVEAEPRHVALDDGDGHLRGRRSASGPSSAAMTSTGRAATAGRSARSPSSAAADRRDREGDQRCAADGGQRRQRGVALAEGEPPPREAAERQPVAQGLLPHPQHGGPDRPALQAGDECQRGAERRQEQGLEQRQGQPGTGPGDGAGPDQQREGRSPEAGQQPQHGAAAAALAADSNSSAPADGREPPQVVRREGEVRAARRRQRRARGRVSTGATRAQSARPGCLRGSEQGPVALRTDPPATGCRRRAVVYWATGPAARDGNPLTSVHRPASTPPVLVIPGAVGTVSGLVAQARSRVAGGSRPVLC